MATNLFSKSLKRSALTVALGLCFASGVSAQSSSGSLFGTTKPSASVKIENLDTGTSREITAGSDGRFSAPQLPTGRYRVTADGFTREVQVKVGTGTPVSLVADSGVTTLEGVTVSASASFNPIDVSSVESTSVFTQEQIQQLPVPRDVISVSLLAPGTVRGDTGFGNVASFGGASPAENGYYINGFDVTNIFNFLSFASLPFDAVGEQQVKTGGYGAEYGRSLGGVVSVVTRRGTNEWKGGVTAYWSPKGLREQSSNVVTRDPTAIADGDIYSVYREDNTSSQFSYNIYGGGPIIKDRLFVFGLLEGRDNESDAYGRTTSGNTRNKQPRGMLKLDWNITDNHLVEVTGISNRSSVDSIDYTNPTGVKYSGVHGDESARYTTDSGGEIYIGKYTGYLTENFTLSAMVGKLEIETGTRDPLLLGSEACPRAFDSRGANANGVTYIGCYSLSSLFVRDPSAPADRDKRDAFRIDGEWHLGSHNLRFGYDSEKWASQRAGQSYTGGIYYRYFKRPTAFTVNGVLLPANTDYVRTWDFRSLSGDFEVENKAAYIEDNWQFNDNLMLYAGLRAETFENFNSEGASFVESGTKLAPRFGFAWDVKGDSSLKVFGTLGRYYIPVAANTSVRLSGGDNLQQNFYFYSGSFDPVTAEPIGGLGALIGPEDTSAPVAPDPRTVAATNLSPMYQDELVLGMQRAMSANWTVGAKVVMRTIRDGMDDYCSHQPFIDWAEDEGYTDFDYNTVAGCMLINPGRDLEIALDLQNDGNLEVVSIPASYFGMPTYQRKYRALELSFERARADGWYLQGSYTLAKNVGNAEGYVNSTLEQVDAGITQDFDHALFTDGSYGPLPNERRHTLKLFGAYEISDEWRIGASFLLQSGRPRNCNGYIPLSSALGVDQSGLQSYSASSFYCPDGNGNTVLRQRGDAGRTPWLFNLDMSVAYTPKWANDKLAIEMQVFNPFNIQRVTEYAERAEVGGNASKEPNLDFGNIVNYQAPRSVNFIARYKF